MPEFPLEEYQVCVTRGWLIGEIAYTTISVLYGVSCPSLHRSRGTGQLPFIEDCAAFLVIVVSARKRGHVHAAGVLTLLGNIFKDAIIYFSVVIAGQLLVIFFNLFAPVSGLLTDSFSSTHLIMAARRDRFGCSQGGKSPSPNVSIRLYPTMCSPTHSANAL